MTPRKPLRPLQTLGGTRKKDGLSSCLDPKRLYCAGLLRDDLSDAGLPEYDSEGHKLVFHSFRRTAGTSLCEHGVDLKVVPAILGPRTCAMTADRYTHARMERVVAEMAKMPELLATGTDESVLCKRCPTMANHVRPWPLTPPLTIPRMRFQLGGVAEWLMAPVLKTDPLRAPVRTQHLRNQSLPTIRPCP